MPCKQREEKIRKAEEARRRKAEEDRQKRKAARKAKKLAKRKSKMDSLQKALELGAMTKMDHDTALRRLQSVTGEDPTNGDRKYTLPETMQWLNTVADALWPRVSPYLSDMTRELLGPVVMRHGAELVSVQLANTSPSLGPIATREVRGLRGEPGGGLELSLGVNYHADVDIVLDAKGQRVRVQTFKFVGTLYFYFRPFLADVPFLGGVAAAFVNPPKLLIAFEKTGGGPAQDGKQGGSRKTEKAVR
eukprot:gene13455-5224_t